MVGSGFVAGVLFGKPKPTTPHCILTLIKKVDDRKWTRRTYIFVAVAESLIILKSNFIGD